MSPSSKIGYVPLKFFLPFFYSENVSFFEKKSYRKNINHLISYKKHHIHFCSQMPYSPQKDHDPQKLSLGIFLENTIVFLKKNYPNKKSGRVTNRGTPAGPKYGSSDALPAPEIFILKIGKFKIFEKHTLFLVNISGLLLTFLKAARASLCSVKETNP